MKRMVSFLLILSSIAVLLSGVWVVCILTKGPEVSEAGVGERAAGYRTDPSVCVFLRSKESTLLPLDGYATEYLQQRGHTVSTRKPSWFDELIGSLEADVNQASVRIQKPNGVFFVGRMDDEGGEPAVLVAWCHEAPNGKIAFRSSVLKAKHEPSKLQQTLEHMGLVMDGAFFDASVDEAKELQLFEAVRLPGDKRRVEARGYKDGKLFRVVAGIKGRGADVRSFAWSEDWDTGNQQGR